MLTKEQFEAIGVHDFDKWLEPKHFTYTPQKTRPEDIDIEIEACGICGSDIHAASGNWGRPYVPVAVGHEIVGKVVGLGEGVDKSRFKLGDRVGVGAQCDSCGKCVRCDNDHENTCRGLIGTYFGKYPESGVATQGGYANKIRVNSKFAFKIPEKLETKYVAPMLCGGITGFRPLMTAGVTKGTKVAVSGIGGIGHMTILFAKAMGAEVTAISRTKNKEADAKKLGVDHYIATDEKGFEEKYRDSFDLVVNTGSSFTGGALEQILSTIKPYGRMIYITVPPAGETLTIQPHSLVTSAVSIGGSPIGSAKDIEYMLEFAAEHDIKPWVETIDINEENVSTAWKRMEKGDVKYRFVLTGYDKYFKNK